MNTDNKLTDDQLIDLLVKTIKQVLATRPQLLFRAFQKIGGDYSFDRIKAELEGKPRLVQSLVMRTAICMMASKILLNSGQAELEKEDLDNIAAYAYFMSKK